VEIFKDMAKVTAERFAELCLKYKVRMDELPAFPPKDFLKRRNLRDFCNL